MLLLEFRSTLRPLRQTFATWRVRFTSTVKGYAENISTALLGCYEILLSSAAQQVWLHCNTNAGP